MAGHSRSPRLFSALLTAWLMPGPLVFARTSLHPPHLQTREQSQSHSPPQRAGGGARARASDPTAFGPGGNVWLGSETGL